MDSAGQFFEDCCRINETVRLAMLVLETRRMIGKTVSVTVGHPIAPEQLTDFEDRRAFVDTLQTETLSFANSS